MLPALLLISSVLETSAPNAPYINVQKSTPPSPNNAQVTSTFAGISSNISNIPPHAL